jgi:hypothetical protein
VSGYRVLVDDNFHYMSVDERYELRTYSTLKEAIAACKRVVDDDLEEWAKRNLSAKELYELYVCFGEDPFIVTVNPSDGPAHFSAWDYAKERCGVLAASNDQ